VAFVQRISDSSNTYYVEFTLPHRKEKRYVSSVLTETIRHTKDSKRAWRFTEQEMDANPVYLSDVIRWIVLPSLKSMGVRLKDIHIRIDGFNEPEMTELIPYWDIFVDWKR